MPCLNHFPTSIKTEKHTQTETVI